MAEYELTHWKRLWCWEGLGAGGEGDDRGWDGWMASLTWRTWVWVNSGSWWWTGRPGVLQFMGLQRVGHDWVNDLIWSEYSILYMYHDFFIHSSVNGHLGCFHVLATVNSAAMAQETRTGALYQPRGVWRGGRWEGVSKGREYMYTYGWFRGACRDTFWGLAKSWTRLSDYHT